jgi:hypothetical protein
MMRLAAGHFRHEDVEQRSRRARALRRRCLDSKGSESRPAPMLADGRLHELSAGPAHPRRDGPTVIAMSCGWSNLATTVPRGAHDRGSHLGPCSRARRAARSVVGIEADAWMQVDGLLQWSVSAGGETTRAGSGRVPSVEGERLTGRQESVSLRHLRLDATWDNGS